MQRAVGFNSSRFDNCTNPFAIDIDAENRITEDSFSNSNVVSGRSSMYVYQTIGEDGVDYYMEVGNADYDSQIIGKVVTAEYKKLIKVYESGR